MLGRPTLRSLDTERVLESRRGRRLHSGPGGAHRVDNRTDEAVRLLVVSTMIAPELNEYPQSGELWGLSFAPGGPRDADAREVLGRRADNPDYLDVET